MSVKDSEYFKNRIDEVVIKVHASGFSFEWTTSPCAYGDGGIAFSKNELFKKLEKLINRIHVNAEEVEGDNTDAVKRLRNMTAEGKFDIPRQEINDGGYEE